MGAIDNTMLLRRHRIPVDEYHRLGQAGVLAPDARVELVDGEVIDTAPIGSLALPGVCIDLTGLFG